MDQISDFPWYRFVSPGHRVRHGDIEIVLFPDDPGHPLYDRYEFLGHGCMICHTHTKGKDVSTMPSRFTPVDVS